MDVVEPAVVVTGGSKRIKVLPGRTMVVRLSHVLAYWALMAASALAERLPTSWVTGLGAAVVGTVGPWLRQNRRALQNLEIAFPDKSDQERRAIARAMWRNMGRIFAETLILDRLVADKQTVTLLDTEGWRQRILDAPSSIVCTLHMGNWELAIWPLHVFDRRPAGVYRPLGIPRIDAWLVRTRSVVFKGGLFGKGNNDDDSKDGQRTARLLIDFARKGGHLGFVCDHYDRRGTAIPFMGREAKFTTAPALIARHVGAKFWVGRLNRIGTTSRFEMEIREIPMVRTGDKSADVKAMTEMVFAIFEAWIRAEPEQWMWWNTRWVKPGLGAVEDPAS